MSRTCPGAPCAWSAPTARATGRSPSRTRTRPRPSRTGSRSSSRPRRWAAPGASGGRPTRTGCWSPGSTTRRCSAGGSRIRRTRTASPAEVAYPAAGTPNAEVRLFVIGLDGSRTEVSWDRARYPYLARVHWSATGPPLLLVQARDQRSELYLAVDLEDGSTRMVHADEDGQWLELFPGVPAWTPSGQLVRIADEGGRAGPRGRRTAADRAAVARAGGAGRRARATCWSRRRRARRRADPETGEVHVYRVNELGVERVSDEPGVHSAVRAGGVTVLASARTDRARHPGAGDAGRQADRDGRLARRAPVADRPADAHGGGRGGSRAPSCSLPAYEEGDGPLPVLLDPYGGPHGQRVLAAHNRAPDLAVVRRPGLRGGRRGRPRHPRPLPRLGEGGRARPRRLTLDDQIDGAARAGRRASRST